MCCGPERGPNGPACLAADKACSVPGLGVNVFPLLAVAPHDSQEEGVEVDEGEPGGLTGGFGPEQGSGARLTLLTTWQKV